MSAKNSPLVSIALCTYNGENHLKMQIDSILEQSYANIELVIVDDCSTDSTRKILVNYQTSDDRIKLYFNEKNLGHTNNFGKAIGLCSGKYIALSDQDDIWVRDKISTLVTAINGNILVYHDSDFIDEEGERIGDNSLATIYHMYEGESLLPLILFNCISGHAALFDRALIKYILPFNEHFFHDWLIAYAAFNVGKIKFINRILVHYRQHRESITDTLSMRDKHLLVRKRSVIQKKALNLQWLSYCKNYKYNKEPILTEKACRALSNMATGKENVKSFLFLLRYFDLLFYISYKVAKGFFSKLNILRKVYLS
ncbi:MAG: glycosyltransferase family 2 protein [Mucilaginibacter sp.]|nr:glycosyltransferase family 2 protein [Mucilaginibacter sp.]